MLAGIALRSFTVYLLKYPYGLLMTLSDKVKGNILIVKFAYIDIAKALTAAECVLFDVLCIHTYFQIHKVLTAVKRPVADSFDISRYSNGFEGPAPRKGAFTYRYD